MRTPSKSNFSRLASARQEIPDPQVKDAADQYNKASRVLAALGAETGVLLPLLNTSVVAIELYLKSLSAEKVLAPRAGSKWSKVSAQPRRGHELVKLLEAIPGEFRKPLEDAFRSRFSTGLKDALRDYENLFGKSRFPYEEGVDVSRYPLGTLMTIAEFCCDYTARLTPIERIEGATQSPDYSPEDIEKFEALRLKLLGRAQ